MRRLDNLLNFGDEKVLSPHKVNKIVLDVDYLDCSHVEFPIEDPQKILNDETLEQA